MNILEPPTNSGSGKGCPPPQSSSPPHTEAPRWAGWAISLCASPLRALQVLGSWPTATCPRSRPGRVLFCPRPWPPSELQQFFNPKHNPTQHLSQVGVEPSSGKPRGGPRGVHAHRLPPQPQALGSFGKGQRARGRRWSWAVPVLQGPRSAPLEDTAPRGGWAVLRCSKSSAGDSADPKSRQAWKGTLLLA